MILSFAPMEGVTGASYRRIHSEMFPGADRYYAPFIAPDSQGNFRLKHLRDVLPDNNQGISLVPQILANSPEAFLSVAGQLRELGYEEVNLNAGCPSGTVVAKHKGAGMLSDLNTLDAFLDRVFSAAPVSVSVKTRMGMNSTHEFPAILEVYKRYPLSELIVHARDRAGLYKSLPDREAFARAFEGCPFPVCYNGNIFNAAHMASLTAEIPGISRVMLGRGAAANPALFRVLKGGPPLSRFELRDFHDRLLDDALSSGLSPHYAMARMKELWYYMIWMFPGSAKEYKALNKSRSLDEYRSAVSCVFSACAFDPDTGFNG